MWHSHYPPPLPAWLAHVVQLEAGFRGCYPELAYRLRAVMDAAQAAAWANGGVWPEPDQIAPPKGTNERALTDAGRWQPHAAFPGDAFARAPWLGIMRAMAYPDRYMASALAAYSDADLAAELGVSPDKARRLRVEGWPPRERWHEQVRHLAIYILGTDPERLDAFLRSVAPTAPDR